MAALLGGLAFLSSAAGRQLLPVPTFSATVVRFASKKSGGSTRNRGGNRTGKRYGYKKFDVFLNLGSLKMCGLQPALLAGEFLKLKSTHLQIAKVEKHCFMPSLLAGQFVHAGNILATQRVIRWHPGAHVGMGHNKWLYALEDGIVRFTKEIYVPPPRSKESQDVICRLPKGAVLYKTFINVVPTEKVGSFKLITMI